MLLRRALFAALFLAAACRHVPAAPVDRSADVAAVFGTDGRPPPAKEGPASPWEKKLRLPGAAEKIRVLLAYEDRAIAEGEGRIYEDADPFKLPPGVYAYVVTREGVTSFGHPIDSWEIGTRHAHVAQRRPVVSAGEMETDGRAVRINVLSGTYAFPMIQAGLWNGDDLRKRTVRWFDVVLRKVHRPPDGLAVVEAVQDGKDAPIFDAHLKLPGLAAVRRLCAAPSFSGNNPDVCRRVSLRREATEPRAAAAP